jgi:phospholipid/cholesterol/gamma-HCH transport system permease protein
LIKTILNLFGSVGNNSLKFIANIGHFFIFCFIAISWIFRPPWYFKKILFQIIDIGYFSLPVVGLTTFFSGMVLALQTYSGLLNLIQNPQ